MRRTKSLTCARNNAAMQELATAMPERPKILPKTQRERDATDQSGIANGKGGISRKTPTSYNDRIRKPARNQTSLRAMHRSCRHKKSLHSKKARPPTAVVGSLRSWHRSAGSTVECPASTLPSSPVPDRGQRSNPQTRTRCFCPSSPSLCCSWPPST